MYNIEKWLLFANIVVSLTAVGTLIVGIRAIKLQNKAIVADHTRRMRQATIEHVTNIRSTWRKERMLIQKEYGTNPVKEEDLAAIKNEGQD